MRGRLWVATLLVLWGWTGTSPSVEGQKKPKRDRNLITRAEIDSADASLDVYDLIRRLRPNMLRVNTGQTSMMGGANPIMVYVEDSPRDLDILRAMNARSVEEIRYLTPIEAGNRFGPNHLSGAILVSRRKAGGGPPPS